MANLFQAIIIWLISLLFVQFQFMIQLSSGILAKGLMQSFDLTALGAGILASSFYVVYVSLQTPAGLIVDRFGARKLLTIGALITMGSAYLFAHSTSFAMALAARSLMGLGTSFAFVCTIYISKNWFPARFFGLMVGLLEAVAVLGTLFGSEILAGSIEHIAWQDILMLAAKFSLFLAIASALIVRDYPKQKPISAKVRFSIKRAVYLVFLRRKYWLNALYCGIQFSMITVYAAVWGIPFMMQMRGLSLGQATKVCATLYAGVAIGGPIVGWLYPKYISARKIMRATAITSAALLTWLLWFTPSTTNMLLLANLALGISCSSYVLTYAVAKDWAPPKCQSTAIGFNNTWCSGTAPFLHPIIGALISMSVPLTTVSHSVVYAASAYQWSLSVLIVLLLVAERFAAWL